MNNILNILKYTTINNLKLNKYKEKDGNKNLLKIISIYGFISLFIILYVVVYTNFTYEFAKTIGIQSYVVPIFMMIASLLVFFAVIRMSEDVLFKAKDYELLITMPINYKDIFITKLMYIMLINYFYTFLIVMPSSIYIMVMENLSIAYLLISIIFSLFVPIIPIILGTIISVLISYISSKLKSTKFIYNTFIILIVLILMFIPNLITDEMLENLTIEILDSKVKNIFYPLYMIKNGLDQFSIIDIFGYIILNILLLYIYSVIISKTYIKINQKLREKVKRKKYVSKQLKNKSPIFMMYKKEIKRLFGTSVYLLNTCIGLILLLFSSISSIFLNDISLYQMTSEFGFNIQILPIIMIGTIVGISCTTGSSISLEGKSIWMYKTMPVKPIDIFLSKIFVNLTVTVPTILISGVIFILRLDLSMKYAIILFVLPILLSISSAVFGLLVNLKFPVLNYDTEIYVVKKSLASMLSMMLPLIINIIVLALTASISMIYSNAFCILTIIVGIIDVILIYILEKWGANRLEKIEI